MAKSNPTSIETTQKRILRKATKAPLLASELGAKMHKDWPDAGYNDARSFGRALGGLVNAGKILKIGKSRPKYAKA